MGLGEIAYAEHAHIAIAPGLGGDPLDDIEEVFALLLAEKTRDPARPACSPCIGDDMSIAAWREEIRRAGLDEADRCANILDLAWVAGERKQRRK